MKGHEFVTGDDSMMSATAMSQNFIDHMDTTFDKWKPRKRYGIFKAQEEIMPRVSKPTKRKNIIGNFRGSEDIFWTKVVRGLNKFLESPFK